MNNGKGNKFTLIAVFVTAFATLMLAWSSHRTATETGRTADITRQTVKLTQENVELTQQTVDLMNKSIELAHYPMIVATLYYDYYDTDLEMLEVERCIEKEKDDALLHYVGTGDGPHRGVSLHIRNNQSSPIGAAYDVRVRDRIVFPRVQYKKERDYRDRDTEEIMVLSPRKAWGQLIFVPGSMEYFRVEILEVSYMNSFTEKREYLESYMPLAIVEKMEETGVVHNTHKKLEGELTSEKVAPQ